MNFVEAGAKNEEPVVAMEMAMGSDPVGIAAESGTMEADHAGIEVDTVQHEEAEPALEIPVFGNATEEDGAFVLSEEVREQITTVLFRRFDLDHSGTVNSTEELRQLTVGSFFTLGRPVDPDCIVDLCATVDIETNPLDRQAFVEWFQNVAPQYLD